MISPRALPRELHTLAELSLDLRLSGSQFVATIWESLDPEAWEHTENPYLILLNARQELLEEAAKDERLLQELKTWLERRRAHLEGPGWFGEQHGDAELGTVAYFSMEFGLSEALPIYSGGLGILAGDHLKSASDLGVPIVGIGLLYQQGYFRQVLAQDGWQLEAMPFNDPSSLPIQPTLSPGGDWPRVRLELPGRTLLLRIWEARVGRVKLYLLDSNDPQNNPWDRGITANLYAAGRDKRLLQEIILGVGGWQLIEQLGIDARVCHLNEGHAAFAVLARAESFARRHDVSFDVALRATRAGNVFTTHTPVDAAFDKFEPAILGKYAQPFAERCGLAIETLYGMGRRDPGDASEPFNMAYLALRGSAHVNGVAQLHGAVSRRLFSVLFPRWPEAEVPVGAVTNGVHVPTWDSGPANELWSRCHPGPERWLENLDAAARGVQEASAKDLWNLRTEQRRLLVHYVRRRLERQLRERGEPEAACRQACHVLDPNFLTLGFARRFTEYKRPNLVLSDAERFAGILKHPTRPVQFIVAGKAHPNDDHGKSMVQAMARFTRRADLCDRVVFLEDHDMVLAQHLAAGIDVWLNNPRRPAEACGTSGMKMLVNGGLHFSTLDGWWDEAYSPQLGWAIGDRREHDGAGDAAEARLLNDVLEHAIVPEFYERDAEGVPQSWVERIRASMSQLAPRFSSSRMVRDYVEHAYLPAAGSFRQRVRDGARLARSLEEWSAKLAEGWRSLRFGETRVAHEEAGLRFDVQVYLGELDAEAVCVQLFADGTDGGPPTVVGMRRQSAIQGAVNGHVYTVSVPADRPAAHFTPRVVPAHEGANVPLEAAFIRWNG